MELGVYWSELGCHWGAAELGVGRPELAKLEDEKKKAMQTELVDVLGKVTGKHVRCLGPLPACYAEVDVVEESKGMSRARGQKRSLSEALNADALPAPAPAKLRRSPRIGDRIRRLF